MCIISKSTIASLVYVDKKNTKIELAQVLTLQNQVSSSTIYSGSKAAFLFVTQWKSNMLCIFKIPDMKQVAEVVCFTF